MENQLIDTHAAPAGQSLPMRLYKNPYLRFLFFGLVLCLLPVLAKAGAIKSSYVVNFGGMLIYAIVALGLNLLLGYSGLISLGTAGFMGLGAYVAGYLTSAMDVPFLVAVLVAVAAATLIGILVGLASLRIAGLYLAIATLCVSEILRKTFEEFDEFTGGFSGLTAKYPTLFGLSFSREATYVLLVVALVLVMMLTYNLVNGQMGRALHAMRGSEVAAQAMGVYLLKYRLVVFALATAYAALGGALYIHFIKFSYPSVWILTMSLNILAVVVIGGLRSIYGTVIGAFIVFVVPDLILKQIPVLGQMNGLPYIFNGVLIILIIMFYPGGVVHLGRDILRLFRKLTGKGGARNG
ncbi:ABC transporter permease [uncultured Eubacteriales bacterium]|uniref:ABC transporter permease n=1 Tax=uncultured Eubacteriales bacterium TaxID=172733 RepID=A0A212KCK1_9FIRM|nr:ABC transporter permease [uncultured Eubacteriales bacterium]